MGDDIAFFLPGISSYLNTTTTSTPSLSAAVTNFLFFRLESDTRHTPVWQSSVRKILSSR